MGFKPSNDYGDALNPAWRIGYELASRTRELLGIGNSDPIRGLGELIETRLGIPVVQMDLPSSFAGATVANGTSRGIVVNLQGFNKNIWVRRMTLAHELGHLLWDPDHRLRKLIVDQYADLIHYADVDRKLRSGRDYVEMRANSFAIEFLAPRNAIREAYEKGGENKLGIEAAMSTFGISKTAALYHLGNAYNGSNAHYGSKDFSEFQNTRRFDMRIDLEPSADWLADEELAVGFFVPNDVPLSRRGRFAAYVAKHVERGLCSRDTAAALLQCQPREVDVALKSINELIVPHLQRGSTAL